MPAIRKTASKPYNIDTGPKMIGAKNCPMKPNVKR